MFASPDYLKEYGPPPRPEDLSGHRLIQSLAMGASPEWPFQENGKTISVRVEPRLRMNTNDAVIELAVRGWGLSRLLSYQIAPDLADGRLRTVLSRFELPPLPIHVVHQEGRMVSAKVRSFVDYMVERLRAHPALN
jgi:DNA-binding transcriptional LysR family regulator